MKCLERKITYLFTSSKIGLLLPVRPIANLSDVLLRAIHFVPAVSYIEILNKSEMNNRKD